MKTILIDAVHTLIVENNNGIFELDTELLQLLESFPNRKISD